MQEAETGQAIQDIVNSMSETSKARKSLHLWAHWSWRGSVVE